MRKRWKQAMLASWTGRPSYTQRIQALGPIAYWPLAESSGVTIVDASGNGRDGTYRNTAGTLVGVTLGAAGIGDGRTSASFDGSTGYGNIYSASLSTAFNGAASAGAEGTLAAWVKVSAAGVWTDAANRWIVDLLGADGSGNNRIQMLRSTVDNTILFAYNAGAGANNKNAFIATGALTGWFHVAMTWSKAADQFKQYVNGAPVGSTVTSLGTWAGAGLTSTFTTIGAQNTTPANVWSGSVAHIAIWNTPLTPAQIASIGVL